VDLEAVSEAFEAGKLPNSRPAAITRASAKRQVSDHRITANKPAGLPPVAGDKEASGNDQRKAELGDFHGCWYFLHLIIIS
jgi:hypothetical protein